MAGIKIKFDFFRKPTRLKSISYWPLGFGVILISMGLGLFYGFSYLPLELKLFYLVEIVSRYNIHLFSLGAISIFIGYILTFFSWRKGSVILDEQYIMIKSQKDFIIKYDEILRLKYLKKNLIEIRSRYDSMRVKFENDKSLNIVWDQIESKTEGIIQLRI